MPELGKETCEACRAGAPLISDEDVNTLMPQIPDWQVIVVDSVMRLQREFTFRDFEQAMDFSNREGAEVHENLKQWHFSVPLGNNPFKERVDTALGKPVDYIIQGRSKVGLVE